MDPKEIATAIARGNAMLTLFHSGVRPLEVRLGYFEWIEPNKVFYFELWGDNEFHGHVLEFERATAAHELGVSFERDGRTIAYICPLSEMEYQTIEQEKLAFDAWREKLAAEPSVMEFILSVRDTLSKEEAE